MELMIRELEIKSSDARGVVAEILKADDIKDDVKEIILIVSKPGAVRGNHYHKKKVEWLCLIKGKGKFLYVDNSTGERREFVIDNRPTIIKTPLNVSHAIKNVGDDDLILVEVSNHVYEEDPDIFKKQVID